MERRFVGQNFIYLTEGVKYVREKRGLQRGRLFLENKNKYALVRPSVQFPFSNFHCVYLVTELDKQWVSVSLKVLSNSETKKVDT